MPRPNSEFLDAVRKAQTIKREIDIAADAMVKLQCRRNAAEHIEQATWAIFALAREGRNDINSQRQCDLIRGAIVSAASPSMLAVETLTAELAKWKRRAEVAEAKYKALRRQVGGNKTVNLSAPKIAS